MIKLWLDDERAAPEGWLRVTLPSVAIGFLEKEIVSHLSLDHDLGLEDNQMDYRTGYDVIAWLEEQVFVHNLKPPKYIFVHSANPVGRKNMEAAIRKITFHGKP